MGKFKFRLATLMRIRQQVRDQRRGQLAEAYDAESQLKQRAEDLNQDLRQLNDEYRRAGGTGSVDVDRLLAAQRYEVVLRSQRQQLREQIDMLATEIERRRLALVEADRDVRVLEKLREKQLRRHREEEGRRETKRLDEVAQQRVAREAVQ